jgi:hypothetical protein
MYRKKRMGTRKGNFLVNHRRYTVGGTRLVKVPAYVLREPWSAAEYKARLASQPSVSSTEQMLMKKGVL